MSERRVLFAVVVLVAAASGSFAYAFYPKALPINPAGDPIVYSIAFTCGFLNVQTSRLMGVKPANYETDINIHNPNTVGVVNVVRKKFVNSTDEPTPGGSVRSRIVSVRGFLLPADMAVDITCLDVYKHMKAPFPQGGIESRA